ncbi:hypothetical protein [Haloarcula montana]|uniref:hypothetical protein n=1 Tax=Haloarcula montana TaxID=3111776 RepID=UPI002D7A1239|nr:hypothetical protein [Haloarcula sp. GH36]
MSGDDSAINEVTTETFRDYLVCYRDTDEAEAVCGDCGRPVCGPAMDISLGGVLGSITGDPGHGRRFHDSTFSQYASGLGRAALGLALVFVSILLSYVFPGLVPGIVAAVSPGPIGLKPALVQSTAILGVASLLTLRYQGGEHSTNFRIRVRKTATRVLCDECFENTMVQLVLFYFLTAVAAVLVIVGLRDIVATGALKPFRIVALGLGLGILRDDIVALAVWILEGGTEQSATAAGAEAAVED